jgi:hypothetical protein
MQRNYSGDTSAHTTAPSDLNAQIIELFDKLSDSGQITILNYLQAVAGNDRETVHRMTRKIDSDLAYLQRMTGGDA